MRRVPEALLESARSYLAGGREAVVARGSSTVMLLRSKVGAGSHDSNAARSMSGSSASIPGSSAEPGIEVYVLRRHARMAFAAGMYAFPGGAVDERDFDEGLAWAGPSPAEWAQRLACEEFEARGLVCAAVRETFEESGVLLAGAHDDGLVTDTTGADWERDRLALIDRSLALSDFLVQRALVLRTDLLGAWAHWITPEFEPRRYDTRFFVAVMPAGQRTRDVSGEADRVAWVKPAEAVAAADEGTMAMLPPTYVTLNELAEYDDPVDALAAAATRHIKAIMPSIEVIDGVPIFVGQGFDALPFGDSKSARQSDKTKR
ncbi:MAG: NUDIX hydrolase [Nocardioidaceae bacterium]|nr:NUDIX hydrolase [Nocardioidaceae bacterium]